MIVLIGLLVLLCLLGAWAAMSLEGAWRQPRSLNLEEDDGQRLWSHVETGPDSFHPTGTDCDMQQRTSNSK